MSFPGGPTSGKRRRRRRNCTASVCFSRASDELCSSVVPDAGEFAEVAKGVTYGVGHTRAQSRRLGTGKVISDAEFDA
jgi:hypothetical protein